MAQVAGEAAVAAESLRAGALELGLDLSDRQIDDLLGYLELMERWGSRFNLTAVRDREAMVATHLLDSLSIASLVRASGATSWLDAGSGAGLPGIPLAIALPDLRFLSVDAVQKKIAFQTQVKGALKLDNFRLKHDRVEALTLSEGIDAATFRAFASLRDGLAGIAAALPSGAPVIAMKAHLDEVELSQIGSLWSLESVQPLAVPGLAATRTAVLLNRR